MADHDPQASFERRGLSPQQSRVRWHFARLGALGALLAALLLEAIFALSGVGEYLHEKTVRVVMFDYTSREQTATRERLGTGDIQLTLDWKGTSDLDLHCDDPSGKRIYFGARRSASGGRLDFDMNAGSAPWSSDSVENIFWPFGSAPEGEYTIYVHAYRRHGGPERTPFHLRVLHQGQVDNIQGVAVFQSGATSLSDPVNLGPPQAVSRFRIQPPLSTMFGQRPEDWIAMLVSGLWVALVSLGLTAAILSGLNRWYREHRTHDLLSSGQSQVLVARSALWGAGHGAIAQAAFAMLGGSALFALELWRLLAWMLLSAWAGARAGRLIPVHLPPREGWRGGLWGGSSGGLGFAFVVACAPLPLLAQADAPGRVLAALLIGGCIGWQVRLPELRQAAPVEEPISAHIEAPAPLEPISEPVPVPTIELRVVRSRGGRHVGGRALGGPRRHSGGRRAHLDDEDAGE